jgi:hypothetical protein
MPARAAALWILAGSAALAADVTFHQDVQPILERKCQSCHRPGEIAPMPFLSYEATRPWAKAIKAAVLTRKMPPWPADSRYGHFANDPCLTQHEIATLVAWADSGAPEGETAGAHQAVAWPDGWKIPPDKVIALPEFSVPASGVVELTDITVPTGFTHDTWVTSIEVRPGNRAVVHHVIVEIVPHRKDDVHGEWSADAKKRDPDGMAVKRIPRSDRLRDITGVEAVYVPGAAPADYRLHDAAKLIPAGSDLLVQMHYTPKGKAAADQTMIGFTLAPAEPARRFITVNPTALRDGAHFHIPPGDPDWETHTEVVFNQDAQLVWFLPHMHLRGKDMTYRLIYPGGESKTLLSVKWDFDWQFAYDAWTPISVPKGARLEVTAHFDNSANNRLNPNPGRDVYWGDQTWEEMMVPWFGVVVPKDADPTKVVTYPRSFAK